jgi:formylglycine-generating enzyme required for sulfatase activity
MNRKTILPLVAVTFTAALLVGTGVASSAITIQTVPVGNVGNAADTTGHGSVNYAYNIGEYDVTSSQYTAFLNAVAQTDPYGVYNAYMAGTTLGNPGIIQSGSPGSYTYSVAAGRGNYPVTDVTFWDATRFANWLDNGQPTGPEGADTTETGTYSLASIGIANNTVTRNLGGSWAVASEDEWYKAAYYDPTLNAGSGGYWLYPTQGNTISTSQANFGGVVGDTTPVGTYAAYPGYYGTYDQGGDVLQWDESTYFGSYHGLRGGSFDSSFTFLQANDIEATYPTVANAYVGFRVSQGPGLDPNAVPVATATSTQTASVAGNYSTPGTGQTFTYAAYEILPGAVAIRISGIHYAAAGFSSSRPSSRGRPTRSYAKTSSCSIARVHAT